MTTWSRSQTHPAAISVRLLLVSVIVIGIVASGSRPLAAADEQESLIFVQAGELPIILSAPHGGRKTVHGIEPRTGETVPTRSGEFVVTRDLGTEELTTLIALGLERRLGKRPYVVTLLAHRKYLDPNRPAEVAYEAAPAKVVYDAYHAALNKFCREVQTKHRSGLLLDIHGQQTLPDAVARGSKHGKTVILLRERFGEAAHIGEASFFGRLRSAGLKVFPDPLNGQDHPKFTGGYIVQTYGSHQGFGLDAMQLEFGSELRSVENRPATADAVVDSIVRFCGDYLPTAPQPIAPKRPTPSK